ncbi:MAG: tyrosine-type recombinase/integrase, partial [Candidatus Bathyarchaeia archaeon]
MSQILEKWEGTLKKNSTKKLYLASVKHFLTCVYGGEFKKPDSEYEDLASKFISECKSGRVWFDDLIAYAISLKDSPPKTAIAYVHAAKKFVEDQLDVELSKKQSKKLNDALPVGSRARTKDGQLTKEILRRILAHCDVKGNALFLFLESSGIRIGEALKLEPSDIDLTQEPVKVRVRGENTKKGDAYDTYISSEAKAALLEWLNVRDSYIATAIRRGKALFKSAAGRGVKQVDDKRIFPFSFAIANSMWTHAITKIKLDIKDASTGRLKFHIHMLRKFFSTQMKAAGLPDAVVQAMIGHSGYLSEYDRFSQKQKDDFYMQGEPYLLLNVLAEEKIKVNSKFDEQDQLIADLYRKLSDSNYYQQHYQAERDQLTKKVERLEKFMD